MSFSNSFMDKARKILLNKDIDGSKASNISRITVPKAGTSDLASLERKEATIAYDTDQAALVVDDGSAFVPIGGGGGGGMDTDFSNADPSAVDIDLNGHLIKNSDTAVDPTDLTNKQYVDDAVSAVTGANTALSNLVATSINQDLIFNTGANVFIKTQDESGGGDSARITVTTGDVLGGGSGRLTITTGEADINSTGQILIISGGPGIDVNSGNASLRSNNATGVGTSGHVLLQSGAAEDGNSGNVSVTTGSTSGIGIRGKFLISAPNTGIGTPTPGSFLTVGDQSAMFGGGETNEPVIVLAGVPPTVDPGRGIVAVVDQRAYNSTNPGGDVTFNGKYNASGDSTIFAQVRGVKSNTADGDYNGELWLRNTSMVSGLRTNVKILPDGSFNILNGKLDTHGNVTYTGVPIDLKIADFSPLTTDYFKRFVLNSTDPTNTITLPTGVNGMNFVFGFVSTNTSTWSFAASGGDVIDTPVSAALNAGTGVVNATFLNGTWYLV